MSAYYDESIPPLIKFLGNLGTWLDEAEATATERGFETSVLVESRLAPDMFPLRRQVQAACDSAKFIGSRLSGTDAPSHPDTETSFDELRARIAATKGFLEGLDPADFEGADERMLALGFLPDGTQLSAIDYLRGFAQANFFFHLSMTYAILRQNGVKLGKRMFIGGLNVVPAPSA